MQVGDMGVARDEHIPSMERVVIAAEPVAVRHDDPVPIERHLPLKRREGNAHILIEPVAVAPH